MPDSPAARSIRGKRRNSTQSAIKAKVERGEATGNERAVVRIGAAATRIITGQDDLSEWDDEELRMGQRRDKNGRFQGRVPKIIPKAIHDELVRRTLSDANELMRENLPAAVQVLVKLAKSNAVEPKDRLRAVNMIMERVMGKSPDKVEISGTSPWLVALQGGIVTVDNDAEEEDDIEEAEWIDG